MKPVDFLTYMKHYANNSEANLEYIRECALIWDVAVCRQYELRYRTGKGDMGLRKPHASDNAQS
jgi:hypothetical protein